jgi:hypothetical protein
MESVQALAERKSEKAWKKECNQWKKKVGDLQREIASWELESRRRATEWEEQAESNEVTAALLRQEKEVIFFLSWCCMRILFIL